MMTAEPSKSRRHHCCNSPLFGLAQLATDLVLRVHNKLRPKRSDPVGLIPEELIWEILIRLPVKSLMRFKCVSRIWRSIITDPSFAEVYRGGSRGFLVSQPGSHRLLPRRWFYFAALDGSPTSQVSRYQIVDHRGVPMGSTGVVNGLICFYHRNRSWLYNIATRESLQLPVSENESETCRYELGFDPINKLYKLLKICPVYEPPYEPYRRRYFVKNLNCEILTIGVDSSWRIVDSLPLPPIAIEWQGVCMDGILYWTTRRLFDVRLIAFHLAEEKFQITVLPEIGCYLPWFGPCLAVCKTKLFHDGTHGTHGTHGTSLYYRDGKSGGGEWSDELTFFLSSEGEDELSVGGILPNGKFVLTEPGRNKPDFPCNLFLFDPIKRERQRIEVVPSEERFIKKRDVVYVDNGCGDDGGYGSDYLDGFSNNWYYYEENVLSLRCEFDSELARL